MNKKSIILIIVIILGIIILGSIFYSKKNIENNSFSNQQNQAVESNNIIESNNQNMNNLLKETLKEGTGIEAKNGDTVTVNYIGTLENGKKFDSSLDGGVPFSFTLGAGQVIKGWDLGVLGMKVGEKRKLTIPADLAYGSDGIGNIIPPNATLIFEVDLLEIK